MLDDAVLEHVLGGLAHCCRHTPGTSRGTGCGSWAVVRRAASHHVTRTNPRNRMTQDNAGSAPLLYATESKAQTPPHRTGMKGEGVRSITRLAAWMSGPEHSAEACQGAILCLVLQRMRLSIPRPWLSLVGTYNDHQHYSVSEEPHRWAPAELVGASPNLEAPHRGR
jgi:hypothetical protein